jgi:hypothetical protein
MKFILIFAILYGLLPLLLFYKLRTDKIDSIMPFLLVVFLASLYEFFGSIILKLKYDNWYLIYKTMAFCGIIYFFKKSIVLIKVYWYLFCILFLIMMFLTFTIWKNVHFFQINSYFNVFQTILVLLFSTLWLRKSFLELETESLWQNPQYYFVAGLNVYYFGTVFLFLTSKEIFFNNSSDFQYFWLLNIILNIVLRTFLIVGIWKARVK